MSRSQTPKPRLRMFAGPNGSGKSIIKAQIESIDTNWIGAYVNPDEIETSIKRHGILDLSAFGVLITTEKLQNFLSDSVLLKRADLQTEAKRLRLVKNQLDFDKVSVNSYFASVLADLIRHELVASHKSFSFETVMSSVDKLEFLEKAKAVGYRNYLYFIATDDPVINVSRVEYRVKTGGHDVPTEKIESRYYRSLENLLSAVKLVNRAYIFDNSGAAAKLIAEVNDGEIEIKSSSIPSWFNKYILEKIA